MLRFALLAAALAALAAAVALAFRRDMERACSRITGRSQVITSPLGDIEYTSTGSGTPVLVVHGSGGGFDQGEFLADMVLDAGMRRIVPSRFGYLRSTFRSGATFDDQAQAYAHLLDELGIDKVAVVAFSHGGPSALLFAAMHPQRVSSLTLLSVGVASSDDAEQHQSNLQGAALMRIYQGDFRYWALTHALRGWFLGLMGADEQVVARLDPQGRQLAAQLIDLMNPVEPRAAGVVFDHRAAMPNQRIAAIQAPTLIVHARDDSLQRHRNAEYAARMIAGSRLVSFDNGGHLLAVVERDAVRALVVQHIRAHAPP